MLNNRVYEYVKDSGIKKIFLIARWSYYTDGGYSGNDFSYVGLSQDDRKDKNVSRDSFVYGYHKTIERYKELGVDINIFSQVPEQVVDPRVFYSRNYDSNEIIGEINNYSVSRNDHIFLQNFVDSVFYSDEQINIYNFTDKFCGEDNCAIGTEKISYYFDNDHLSKKGSKLLVPEIEKAIDANDSFFSYKRQVDPSSADPLLDGEI